MRRRKYNHFYFGGGRVKCTATWRNGLAVLHKAKYLTTAQPSNCTLGKIPHKGDLLFMFKICMQMCIALLFVISHGIVRIFMPCKYSYFEISISMVIVLGSREH